MSIDFEKVSANIIFLVALTLPMYTGINNLLLGLFVIVSIFVFFLKDRTSRVETPLKFFTPVLLFFLLAVLASLNNSGLHFLKHLEKYWSFLLVPLAFSSLRSEVYRIESSLFKGLVFGSAVTLLICYGNVVYEMIVNSEPLPYFLRWRHLGHDFVRVADTHPAYLGLFICTATYYLLFHENKLNKTLKITLLILFSLGMLQLVSRMALFIYILVFGLYLLKNISKYKKQLIAIFLFIATGTALFFYYGSAYLKDRLFSTESVEGDSRFERLRVSYDIFKEHPFWGVGFDSVDEVRVEKYTNYGYIVAAHREYNAHNQFMEYLSINGVLGGTVYLGVFTFLIIFAVRKKEYLFLFIIVSFFLANLTESMMVRIKGIEYFSLFLAFFIWKYFKSNTLIEK
ncbi:O-antigen ligase family protein [Mangrovimonas aestuarii]|uniref:O-antigen ligase family protein n=1 Tax=Mangrovimonas aestuarii TaxID=3018443 RepID=UPI002378ABDF|nr:O-antigen ligase family protein [Mangrovimonas aestuarii]